MRVERERGGVRVGNNRKNREWGVRWMSRKGEREREVGGRSDFGGVREFGEGEVRGRSERVGREEIK